MESDKHNPGYERKDTSAEHRVELTQDQYDLIKDADLGDVRALGILPAAALENQRAVVSITDEKGSKREIVMNTGSEDFGTTDREATDALRSYGSTHRKGAGIYVADQLGENTQGEVRDDFESTFDTFTAEQDIEGDGNEDVYKDIRRKAKGEYAHLIHNLVEELAEDVSETISRLNRTLETSVLGARILESSARLLNELAFNAQMGEYDPNTVRYKLEQTAQMIDEAARRFTEGAKESQKIPGVLTEELKRPIDRTVQALLRADSDYEGLLQQAAHDSNQREVASDNIDNADDIRNDVITLSEMVQEWVSMADISNRLEGGVKVIPALWDTLNELRRASYRGKIDSFELQRMAASIDAVLNGIAAEAYVTKSHNHINKIRAQVGRLTSSA